MTNIEQILIDALKRPIIINSFNPRSDRMRYLNAMKTIRNKVLREMFLLEKPLSVLTRQKENRIIIGPKEFDIYFPFTFDLGTCSQEELEKTFKATFKGVTVNVNDWLEIGQKQARDAARNIADELEEEGNKGYLEAFGFGKKKEEKKDE